MDRTQERATLEQIRRLVSDELRSFEVDLQSRLGAEDSPLDRIVAAHLRTPGKRLRPMLVFLCTRLTGPVGPTAQRAAMLIELLHGASLLHDDVVDLSSERRGGPTAHVVWGNQLAVLAGDRLLALAVECLAEEPGGLLVRLFSDGVRDLAAGAASELMAARRGSLDEPGFERIARLKTASLFGLACRAGALTATKGAPPREGLVRYGEEVGMLYQIADDVADWVHPPGSREDTGLATLPLVRALSRSSDFERKRIAALLRVSSGEGAQDLFDLVHRHDGVGYALKRAREHADRASEVARSFGGSRFAGALRALPTSLLAGIEARADGFRGDQFVGEGR